MRRVILESPYAGNIRRNTAYAKLCLRDCLARGEAPLASHLLYPQVLDEDFQPERRLGIEAGLAWMPHADAVVVYQDFGRSRGMVNAICEAQRFRLPIEYRWLVINTAEPFMSETDKEIELGIHWSSPIRRWWRAIWGEPATLSSQPTRQAKNIRENSQATTSLDGTQGLKDVGLDKDRIDDPAYINQTLARNAPSPVPFGEDKQLD